MKIKFLIALQACLALSNAGDFSTSQYQSQTAQQKMDQLWTEISSVQTSNTWFNLFQKAELFTEKISLTFDTFGDVFPAGRKKLVHSVGVIAQGELIAEPGNPYTGMFQGVSNALVRISPTNHLEPEKNPEDNYSPALSLKLLRDGRPSANILAMYAIEGQPTWNTFGVDWSNHIPAGKSLLLRAVANKFAQATPYTQSLGLKPWAQYDEKGNEVKDLKLPFQLIFRPTSESKNLFPDTYAGDVLDQLQTVANGTTLWDILAIENPGSTPVKVGSIKLKSKFIRSLFGDKNLFFQHNYMDDDIALHPEWKDHVIINSDPIARAHRWMNGK